MQLAQPALLLTTPAHANLLPAAPQPPSPHHPAHTWPDAGATAAGAEWSLTARPAASPSSIPHISTARWPGAHVVDIDALHTSDELTDSCAQHGTEQGSDPPSSQRNPAQGPAGTLPCARPLPYFAVLYTSGSTGLPYGVRMTEGAWLHRIRWMQLHGPRRCTGTPGAGGQDQCHDQSQPCRLYGMGIPPSHHPRSTSACIWNSSELEAKAGFVEEAEAQSGEEAEPVDGASWVPPPGMRTAAGAAEAAAAGAVGCCSVVCFSTAVSFVDHLWQLLAPALAPAMSEAAAAAAVQPAAVEQAAAVAGAAAAVGGGSQGAVAAGVGLGDSDMGSAAVGVQLPYSCGDAQLDAAEVAAAAAAGPCGVLVPPTGAVLRPEVFVRALADHGATHLVGSVFARVTLFRSTASRLWLRRVQVLHGAFFGA